ncbi:MAG: protein translocase subunit SecD, partial [Pseudomonadota bacterium]
MDNKRNWKAWATAGLMVLAILQILPSLVEMPAFYTSIFGNQLNLGLDLKGGLELKYTVDYKRAIADNTNKLRDALRERLVDAASKKSGKDGATLTQAERDEIGKRFTITKTGVGSLDVAFAQADEVALLDKDMVDTIDQRFELRSADGKASLFLPDTAINELKNEIVAQTLQVVRKRVDAFGLVEPDVRKSGDADIDVQLPGLSERQMAVVREKIGQAAQLTFRMVVPEAKVFGSQQSAVESFKAANAEKAKTLQWSQDGRGAFLRSEKKSELLAFIKTISVPDNVMIGYELVEEKDPGSNEVRDRYWRTYDLQSVAPLTGDNLTRAAVGYGEKGEPVVNLEFDSRGARIFGDLTEKNVGNLMAIMLDGDVSSAPRINERIGGGRAQITLGGARSVAQQMEEARALVTVLNNGAYKAPVIKVHDVEVGPSLGRDAVRSGMISI